MSFWPLSRAPNSGWLAGQSAACGSQSKMVAGRPADIYIMRPMFRAASSRNSHGRPHNIAAAAVALNSADVCQRRHFRPPRGASVVLPELCCLSCGPSAERV